MAFSFLVGAVGCSDPYGGGTYDPGGGYGGYYPDATPEADAGPPDGATPDGAPSDGGATSRELVYIASYLSGIDAFEIDPASGALVAVPGSPFAAQGRFYGLAPDPSGNLLYAADFNGGSVQAFRIEPATGALAAVDGFPVDIDAAATTIAVDPLGRFVYVGSFDLTSLESAFHVFRVDPATGALSPVDDSPFAIQVDAIAPDPSGRFIYATGRELGIRGFTVDADGVLGKLDAPFGDDVVASGWLAFHPDGTNVYNARNALSAFAMDPDTGALAALPGSPFAPAAGGDPGAIGIAVDAGGRFVCVVDFVHAEVAVYAIDAGGRLAEVSGSPFATGPFPYSVAIDPDGRFVYVVTDGSGIDAFSIDPESFALTRVSASPFPTTRLQPQIVIVRAPDVR